MHSRFILTLDIKINDSHFENFIQKTTHDLVILKMYIVLILFLAFENFTSDRSKKNLERSNGRTFANVRLAKVLYGRYCIS